MKVRGMIALAAVTALAGCQQPAARSLSYFQAHPDEARAVADQCRAGTKTGGECASAEQVVRKIDNTNELKRELGDIKRKPDKSLHF